MTYARTLEALSDPTRRAIFEKLRTGPHSVSELTAGMTVSQPAVSQHLKVLREARLVAARREGRRRIYSMSVAGLESLRAYVDSFWSDVLQAFAAQEEGA
jgi:DNA-binding transcriptional ArsR family regulator